MEQYKFLDSVTCLQENFGYKRTNLGLFCPEKQVHSDIEDVKNLRDVARHYKLTKDYLSCLYTPQDMLLYLTSKLPINLDKLYKLAAAASSQDALEIMLHLYAMKKTALSLKQVIF